MWGKCLDMDKVKKYWQKKKKKIKRNVLIQSKDKNT